MKINAEQQVSKSSMTQIMHFRKKRKGLMIVGTRRFGEAESWFQVGCDELSLLIALRTAHDTINLHYQNI